jgi:hypothetical protein
MQVAEQQEAAPGAELKISRSSIIFATIWIRSVILRLARIHFLYVG